MIIPAKRLPDTNDTINVLGESYHLGDKITFLLKESNGQIIGHLIAGGPGNEISPKNQSFSDKIIVYATGYKNHGIYAVFESDIAKVNYAQKYSDRKELKHDWE